MAQVPLTFILLVVLVAIQYIRKGTLAALKVSRIEVIFDQDQIAVIFFQRPLSATMAEVAVKVVGVIAAG